MPETDQFDTVAATAQELHEISRRVAGAPTIRYVGRLASGGGAIVDVYARGAEGARIETSVVDREGAAKRLSRVDVRRVAKTLAAVVITDEEHARTHNSVVPMAAGGSCSATVAQGACLAVTAAELACASTPPPARVAACAGVAVAAVGCFIFESVCFFVDLLQTDPTRSIPKNVLEDGGYALNGECVVSVATCTIYAYAVLKPGDVPDTSLAAFWHTEPDVMSWSEHTVSWSVIGTTAQYVIYQTGGESVYGSPQPFASCATWVDLWLGDVQQQVQKRSSPDACADYYGYP